MLTANAGARATFSFTGTGANWIAYRDEWSGIANVYLDGTLKGQVDTYATPSKPQAQMYSISGLASGSHTLAIEATGTKGATSGGAWVWVDAFEVASASAEKGPWAIVMFDPTQPSVIYLQTLATSIYQYASRGSFEDGALAALLIVAASIGPVAWLTRFSDIPSGPA